MTTWGICATTNNPGDQVLAFVAHHLSLGASQIDIYLDNPDDPVGKRLAKLDRLSVTRCDHTYWMNLNGRRPVRHQERQRQNLARSYRGTKVDWLLHIDIDEFILSGTDVREILEAAPAGQFCVRAAPFEALHDPELPFDIFTARKFRAQLKAPETIDAVFGDLAPVMQAGLLSHVRGKSFLRAGIPNLVPYIHHAQVGSRSGLDYPFHPDLKLLHFHAHDPDQWCQAATYRAVQGAYSFRKELATHILSLNTAGLQEFHRRIHQLTPAAEQLLRQQDLLIEADLQLLRKVEALTKQDRGLRAVA